MGAKGMARAGLLLLALLAGAAIARAEWTVIQPNIMTVAFGVSAPNDNTVFLSGGDNGSGASILKSTDGGLSVTQLPTDLQMMFMAVDMSSETSGVAGSLGFWGYTAPGSLTEDGNTFTAFGENVLFSAAQSVVSVDNQTSFLVGFFQFSWNASDFVSGIALTTDGGNSFGYLNWNIDNSPRYGAESNGAWIITGGVWASTGMEKVADDQMYTPLSSRFGVVSSGSPLDKSVKHALRANVRADKVPVGTAAPGYSGVIARSTDQGRTWQLVFEDYDRFYFNGVNCWQYSCWAVAEGPTGGWIFSSNDGGATWTENSFHAGASLMDIEFSSRLEGWAIGGTFTENTFNALFLRTVDGGVTWTTGETIRNAYPNGITVAENRAYASAFMRNGLSSLLAYED